MTLTPTASNDPVTKLEQGNPNSAIVLNVVPQGFVNQCLAISIELEAIAAIQAQTETKLTQLSDAISLKEGAIALKATLQTERNQSATSDTQATNVENALPTLNTNINIEQARTTGINTKLDGITNSTYQKFDTKLSAIASAVPSANKYVYRNPESVTSYEEPQLSSGTKMRDCILEALIVAGVSSPSIPNESEWDIPLVQRLNMANDVISWNATTKELTLGIGEFSIEGYVAACRTQLIQMLLVQGLTRYMGTTGKGTNESGVIGSDNLTIYSHLLTSFKVTSARIYKPQLFLSSGAIVSSSLGETTPYAFLRVRHYQ